MFMFKKPAILQAATGLFYANGFHGASTGEITVLTVTARGTIFQRFKSKAAFLIIILKEVKTGLFEAFDRYLDENEFETGLEMKERIISFFLYSAGQMEDGFIRLHQNHTHKSAEVNQIETKRFSKGEIHGRQ